MLVFGWNESEFWAFRQATADAVDGPHRTNCCGHCIDIARLRTVLMKDRPLMTRWTELRRHRSRLLLREGVET